MRLLCTLGLFLALLHLSTSLLLGAFNIQTFGPSKASKVDVMNHITTIVRLYDIIVIQEVRDKDLSITQTLMNYVNNPTADYNYIVSDPLGGGAHKERYLFLYRHQMVTVTATDQYDPPGVFSRPPFIVRFNSPQTTVTDFVLIPQHTSPPRAVQQIDALFDVNIVLLGDFNAGCTYVTTTKWQNIRLYTQPGFNWLIGNQVDTTVSRSNCPYDRIVATDDMMRGVVPATAVVYNYEVLMHLTHDEARNVSDHFPVEVQLN